MTTLRLQWAPQQPATKVPCAILAGDFCCMSYTTLSLSLPLFLVCLFAIIYPIKATKNNKKTKTFRCHVHVQYMKNWKQHSSVQDCFVLCRLSFPSICKNFWLCMCLLIITIINSLKAVWHRLVQHYEREHMFICGNHWITAVWGPLPGAQSSPIDLEWHSAAQRQIENTSLWIWSKLSNLFCLVCLKVPGLWERLVCVFQPLMSFRVCFQCMLR